MNDATPVERNNARRNETRRTRVAKRAQGLREIRIWVPDVHAPGFQERLRDQIARINASEDEREVMIFCDAMADEMWRNLD